MKAIARPVLLSAVLAAASVAPAAADSTSNVQARLDAALKGARSYVVTTLYPAQSYSATLVFVAPDRSRTTIAVAGNTTDVISVGSTTYSSKNGRPFERDPAGADAMRKSAPLGSVKVTGLHPDVTLLGVTYGAFETTLPLGQPVTLSCTYEKRNYRLVRCANDDVIQTYVNYDDVQNAVDVPKYAIDAPKAGPKDVK